MESKRGSFVFNMHVSGKEVKASDITGRQNDAKRPNVKYF